MYEVPSIHCITVTTFHLITDPKNQIHQDYVSSKRFGSFDDYISGDFGKWMSCVSNQTDLACKDFVDVKS